MELPQEIEAIAHASDVELRLICAAAAERAAAFHRVLGAVEDLAWVEDLLELAWSAAAGEAVLDECADALDSLEIQYESDDEYEESDTSRPRFYLEQSLAMVGNALGVSLRPDPERAEMSVKTTRTLLSMLDFTLGGEKVVIVRHGDPSPEPGPLEQAEIFAQREVLSILARERERGGRLEDLPVLSSRIRESASIFAAKLIPPIKEFAELHHWDL